MDGFGLVLMAKTPVPGRVKTRLSPPFTPEQATALAAAALRDSAEAVRRCPAASRLVALDDGGAGGAGGHPDEVAGLAVVAQRGAGLAQRLDHALATAWDLRKVPQLVIGMDTPQVTPGLLRQVALSAAAPDQVVLGRACDGGFWCLGFGGPPSAVLHDVPMSLPDTADRAEALLRGHGFTVIAGPVLEDVDDAASAARVAAEAPETHFARVHRALTRPGS